MIKAFLIRLFIIAIWKNACPVDGESVHLEAHFRHQTDIFLIPVVMIYAFVWWIADAWKNVFRKTAWLLLCTSRKMIRTGLSLAIFVPSTFTLVWCCCTTSVKPFWKTHLSPHHKSSFMQCFCIYTHVFLECHGQPMFIWILPFIPGSKYLWLTMQFCFRIRCQSLGTPFPIEMNILASKAEDCIFIDTGFIIHIRQFLPLSIHADHIRNDGFFSFQPVKPLISSVKCNVYHGYLFSSIFPNADITWWNINRKFIEPSFLIQWEIHQFKIPYPGNRLIFICAGKCACLCNMGMLNIFICMLIDWEGKESAC